MSCFVLFENRSLDNMLGHLYAPEDGKNFDGVIGKNLSNHRGIGSCTYTFGRVPERL